jgi:hypothetical protein
VRNAGNDSYIIGAFGNTSHHDPGRYRKSK